MSVRRYYSLVSRSFRFPSSIVHPSIHPSALRGAMAQQFNRTLSLRAWPSMYGDYEFNDDDDEDENKTKANFEQVKQ